MNLLTTYAGSMMEGFLPRGWDLAKIDACCAHPPRPSTSVRPGGIRDSSSLACDSVADFDVMMGHEIATGDQAGSRPGAVGRPDPAGRPDGHVSLGGVLSQGMGCLM